MKKTIAALTLSTFLGCFPLSPHAETYADMETGHGILSTCSSGEPVWSMLCYGTVRGVHSSLSLAYAYGEQRVACLPDRVIPMLDAEIVVRYLRAHPHDLDAGGIALIRAALTEAYPCPTAR